MITHAYYPEYSGAATQCHTLSKKLIKKGWIKLINFSHNQNKVGYVYLLTPKGIEEKTRLTFAFLKIKMEEYEMLKDEISKLKQDTKKLQSEQK